MSHHHHVFERRIVWALTALATVVFLLLAAVLPTGRLILILNGAFIGATISMLVTYWRFIANIFIGPKHYDRVDQTGLGFFMIWFAYLIGVGISIYYRSSTIGPTSFLASAISRYIAIIGTALLVSAPDFGSSPIYGKDRKSLIAGLIVGPAVALLLIALQYNKVLAE